MAEVFIQKSKIPEYTKEYSSKCLRRSALHLARHEGRLKMSKSADICKECFEGQAIFFLASYLMDPIDPGARSHMQFGLKMARIADDFDDITRSQNAVDVFIHESAMRNADSVEGWTLQVADPAVL